MGSSITDIELVAFDGSADSSGRVTLQWETAAEVNNAGFNLYRRVAGSASAENTLITPDLIASQSSTGAGATYTYADDPGAGQWTYTLASVATNGIEQVEGSVDVFVEAPTSAETVMFDAAETRSPALIVVLVAASALALGGVALTRSRLA